jgi:hypothetical protein
VEHRVVLQVDQAAPENQAVLGYDRECDTSANLLCNNHLLPCGDLHHDLRLERSVYETLQILGISLTDKTPLGDLFDKSNINIFKEPNGSSEPNLFDF